MELSTPHPDEPERLVVEPGWPPRFYKEEAAAVGGKTSANYVYTTDFVNGQASSAATFCPRPGAERTRRRSRRLGAPVDRSPASAATAPGAASAGRAGGAHAASAALRQPPRARHGARLARPPRPRAAPTSPRPSSLAPAHPHLPIRARAGSTRSSCRSSSTARWATGRRGTPGPAGARAGVRDGLRRLLTSVGRGLPKRGSLLDRVRGGAAGTTRTARRSSVHRPRQPQADGGGRVGATSRR